MKHFAIFIFIIASVFTLLVGCSSSNTKASMNQQKKKFDHWD